MNDIHWHDSGVGRVHCTKVKFDAMIAATGLPCDQEDDPRDPDVEYDRATEQGVRHE